MSISNVNIIRDKGQNRALFEGFNTANDLSKKTGKVGVRCHGWLTAIFLRILGKIVHVKTSEGKTIHLNKNSLKKWKLRHLSQLKKDPPKDKLPTVEEIVKEHKKVQDQQKAVSAATLLQKHCRAFLAKNQLKKLKQKREKAATVLQSHIRKHLAETKVGQLKKIKAEIEAAKQDITSREEEIAKREDEFAAKQEIIQDYITKKERVESEVSKLSANFAQLKTETDALDKKPFAMFSQELKLKKAQLQKLEASKQDKQLLVDFYNSQIADLTKQIHPQEKEKILQPLRDGIEQAKQKLSEKNEEYNALIVGINSAKPASSSPPQEETPAPDAIETAESGTDQVSTEQAAQEPVAPQPVDPYTEMTADMDAHANPQLANLLKSVFSQFEAQTIKSWEYDPQTGDFKIGFAKPAKLWVNPKDSQTPKGVVFLLGCKNGSELAGRIDKGGSTIHFSKGFDTFCHFKKKVLFTIRGVADGRIKNISFANDKFTVNATGKDRKTGMGANEKNVKNADELLSIWGNGQVVQDDHEQFMKGLSV